MQKTEIITDKNQKELITRGSLPFPCAVYYSDITKYVTGDIPWHWHEELEFFIVDKGRIYTNLGEKGFTLKKGEGAFINSNVLHSMQIEGSKGCNLITFVFDPKIIAGSPESVFDQKYIRPLMASDSLKTVIFKPEIAWQQQIIQAIINAYQENESKNYGFEFLVRDNLSRASYLLLKNMQAVIERQKQNKTTDTVRIKKMLDFIHSNYSNQIEVEQIARAASISRRECFRCFKKTLGSSPAVYLLKHRLSVAARLLKATNITITEICSRSGFNTPSYFSKVFKQYIHCSPSSYRNQDNN